MLLFVDYMINVFKNHSIKKLELKYTLVLF